jgi:hypothetical protein
MIQVGIALLGLLCWGAALLYQGHPLIIYVDPSMIASLGLTLAVAVLWWPRYRHLAQGRQRWGAMAWKLQLQAGGLIVIAHLLQMLYQLQLAPETVKVGASLGLVLLLPLYLGIIRLILRPERNYS